MIFSDMAARDEEVFREINGADALVEWFGYWPSFHDGKVLSIDHQNSRSMRMRIHTWELTREVDEKGFFKTRKNVVVTFGISDIRQLQFEHFGVPNTLVELEVTRAEGGLRLLLNDVCDGTGEIVAGAVRIDLEPAPPNGRIGEDAS